MSKWKIAGFAVIGFVCISLYNAADNAWNDHKQAKQQQQVKAAADARWAKLSPEQQQAELAARAERNRVAAEQAATVARLAEADRAKKAADEKNFQDGQVAAYAAIKQVVMHARDPRSVVVHDATYVVGQKSSSACIEYGARNGFGGMNRELVMAIVTGDKVTFKQNDVRAWNATCVGTGYDVTYTAKNAVSALTKRM